MRTITVQIQQGIFEKVLRGKDGRLYTVRFVVAEVGGQVRAKIVSAHLVPVLKGFATQDLRRVNKTALLPDFIKTTNYKPQTKNYFSFVSPFVSNFDFFTSQMTRAPSARL